MGLTTYGRPANAMIPILSFGRPSMNFRVTSRMASPRVASCPPIVKSFVSIDPETSSTSMMSIPLASTCVRLLPSCGRARAMTKIASDASSRDRRIFPTRAALCFPMARNADVDENVNAAVGPRLPRKYASNGIANKSNNNNGRANVSALFAVHQSNSCKLLPSFHKSGCFFEQELAVRRSRLIARELDQVASIQKIFEQRLLIARKLRRLGQRV